MGQTIQIRYAKWTRAQLKFSYYLCLISLIYQMISHLQDESIPIVDSRTCGLSIFLSIWSIFTTFPLDSISPRPRMHPSTIRTIGWPSRFTMISRRSTKWESNGKLRESISQQLCARSLHILYWLNYLNHLWPLGNILGIPGLLICSVCRVLTRPLCVCTRTDLLAHGSEMIYLFILFIYLSDCVFWYLFSFYSLNKSILRCMQVQLNKV